MLRQNMKKDAIKLFEYFNKKQYNNPRYFLDRSERNLKIIDNFLKIFGERTKYDLYDFVCFQFSRLHDQEIKLSCIQLNWVFGKKALSYYNKRNEQQIYFMRLFKMKFKIKNILDKSAKIYYGEYYKKERERFFNTNRGYIHCQEMGILYSHKSPECFRCKFKKYCKN